MNKVPLNFTYVLSLGSWSAWRAGFPWSIQLVEYQKELGNAKRPCQGFHLQLTCVLIQLCRLDVEAVLIVFLLIWRFCPCFLDGLMKETKNYFSCSHSSSATKRKSRTSYFRLMCAIILDWEVTDLAVQNWINEVLHLIVFWPNSFYVLLSACKVPGTQRPV